MAAGSIRAAPSRTGRSRDLRMTSSYVRVLVVWVLVLAGLYAMQAYFS